ncbi:hypothetical protein Sjap_026455 [Stephania japonica]|uniref:Uncharacterized protein n=1 Tax=Stephania japonica TaxID=461633 RepID=A0AAP0E3S1_9MAGN
MTSILLENRFHSLYLVDLFDMIETPKGDLHLEEYVRYFFRDVLRQLGYKTPIATLELTLTICLDFRTHGLFPILPNGKPHRTLEQCDGRYAPPVSSYVILLDSLIASPKDVRLLRREAIIDSFFGDDEELVSIIKQLSKGLVVSRFFFA